MAKILFDFRRDVGMNMDKYEVKYRFLVQKYSLTSQHHVVHGIFYDKQQYPPNAQQFYDESALLSRQQSLHENETFVRRPRRNSFTSFRQNHMDGGFGGTEMQQMLENGNEVGVFLSFDQNSHQNFRIIRLLKGLVEIPEARFCR